MHIYIFIGTVDLILSIITYTYLRLHCTWARSWLFVLLFLFLMVNMVGCRALPQDTPLFIVKLSAWLSGLWIAVMYYILLLSVLHGFLHLMAKITHWQLPHDKIAAAALTFIVLFIVWGCFRAFHPTIRTETITTEKLPHGTHYKIVFLTDLHMGQILGRDYAERLVARVNAQNADFVLISGDLLDERIRYLERENTLDALPKLQSRLGTYMAFGNHDYLDRPDYWQQILEQLGLHILRNKDIVLEDKIKITGINDWSKNKSNSGLLNLSQHNQDFYSILMDHQPRRMDAASEVGYDLYLAGHTHTGQLFPNRQVTKRMYKLDYGRALFGNMTAITNNGYGFWGPPVRTEVAPEMVVIELQGK